MRFPYASYREENLEWLREWNYLVIEGRIPSTGQDRQARGFVERVIPKLVKGSILMFHANEIAKETPQAVISLVHETQAKGLDAVTVSELQANGIRAGERDWQVRFKPTLQGAFHSEQWSRVAGEDELRKLAADSLEWGIRKLRQDSAPIANGRKHSPCISSRTVKRVLSPALCRPALGIRACFGPRRRVGVRGLRYEGSPFGRLDLYPAVGGPRGISLGLRLDYQHTGHAPYPQAV